MSLLEDLVRKTLVAHENEGSDPARVLAGVRAGLLRRRRRDQALVGVLIAALAATTGGVLFAIVHRSPSVSPVTSIPPGTQPVSFHGVEIFVPAQWKLNNTDCGTPVADTVITPFAATPSCFVSQRPGLTVARLITLASQEGRQEARVATKPVTVDGHQGRRGTGEYFGKRLAVLVLPDPGVVISVESVNMTKAGRILDSTRVVAVDWAGCTDHVEPLAPKSPDKRAGTPSLLVPGTPENASICRYDDNWLSISVRLSQTQMDSLRNILNALPQGTSFPGNGTESADACAEDTHRGFIARFNYASGEPLLVYTHIGGCAGLTASNGSRTTKINEPLVTFLTDVAGYDSGFPNPQELR